MLKIPEEAKGKKIVGIFGDPVSQSLSPRMHNYAFKKLGLPFHYAPFPVRAEDLKEAVNDIQRQDIVGVNVTIPHKETVIEHILDSGGELGPEAGRIGAVNTVINEKGRLIGRNTDEQGFEMSLRGAGFDPKGKTAVIWGAGGAARAIAFSLARSGARKTVLTNRTYERANQIAKDVTDYLSRTDPARAAFAMDIKDRDLLHVLQDCNLFINATPVGIASPFPFEPREFLSPKMWVYDVVYAKATRLLAEAKKAGCPALGGAEMLIYQGAYSFRFWTQVERPPIDLMRESLVEYT